MAKRTIMLAPQVESRTVALATDTDGMTFRKKILPLATITYPKTKFHPGGPVNFDHAFHQDLIDSFAAHAYDNPTLQLATETNGHNMLPERAAGDVTELSHMQADDVDGPGLYATIRAHSPEHAEMLKRNPKLGVSPEIVSGRKRVDGQKFRHALRHVLATLDPRVVGLGQWRAVSLSEDEDDNGRVIDLTEADYEEIDMGKQKTDDVDVLSLSDDELDAALAAAAAEFGTTDVTDDDEPTAPAVVRLAAEDREFVTSLAAEAAELREEAKLGRANLAATRWEAERAELSAAGVPKSILDLAGEVLGSADEAVLSLSNVDEDGDLETKDVDARAVVRKMTQACASVISLADPRGFGGEPDEKDAQDDVKRGQDLWDKRSGPAH